MHRQLYVVCGLLLLGAGLMGILGGALHGTQPATLAALAEIDPARWRLSHGLIAVAGAVFVVAAPMATRAFMGTAGEALAWVGAGSLLLNGLALLFVGTLETTGFLGLLGTAEAAGEQAAEHAFVAVGAVMASASAIGGYAFPLAVAAFGFAMLAGKTGPAWLAWLAWLGIVAAALGIAARLFGFALPGGGALLPYYTWNAWFVAMGAVLLRLASAAEAITLAGRSQAAAR